MRYKVYFVGAGPGDPGLITLKGLEILRQADVVIYDYLVDKRILSEAQKGAELICCDKLGKKRSGDGFILHQEKINSLIVKRAKEGKKVIRLKNGDVSIFSRWSQELEALAKEKIEFEVVPGVTAASAAACLSGIPLTDRNFASSVVMITGREDPRKEKSVLNWQSLAKCGTIVLYMAVENLANIVKWLKQAGKTFDTPVAIVENASLLTQKVLVGSLKDIAAKARKNKVKPPAIIIIGEVVKLERKFNWLKKTERTLFTGISPERFFEKGIIIHLPLIKIMPLEDYSEFNRAVKDIGSHNWIVFSSRYGVKYFFERLNKIGLDARNFSQAKISAIGNSTRNRLLDFGVITNLVPKEESSLGLLKEFKNVDIRNQRIFLPRSDIADKGLTQGLQAQGAKVTATVVYRNVMPDNLPDLDLEFFDEIMFTSPSGVRNFVKRYGSLPKKVRVRCIGEVTLKEARKWNLSD